MIKGTLLTLNENLKVETKITGFSDVSTKTVKFGVGLRRFW
jgi:hypothetical protein